MGGVIVFSWNLEKCSFGKIFDKEKRNVIVGTIAESINGAKINKDDKIVGFLLEIQVGKKHIDDVCEAIEEDLNKLINGSESRKINVGSMHLNSNQSNNEHIICFSTEPMENLNAINIQNDLKESISKDAIEAKNKFSARNQYVHDRYQGIKERQDFLKKMKKNPSIYSQPVEDYEVKLQEVSSKEEHFKTFTREAEWFRNGVSFSVDDDKGGTLKIAAFHAPGPEITSKIPAVHEKILGALERGGVHVAIGDFNKDGNVGNNHYSDAGKEKWKGKGTTFRASKRDYVLGNRMRDRVLTAKNSEYDTDVGDPIIPVKHDPFENVKKKAKNVDGNVIKLDNKKNDKKKSYRGEKISDHAAIIAYVSNKSDPSPVDSKLSDDKIGSGKVNSKRKNYSSIDDLFEEAMSPDDIGDVSYKKSSFLSKKEGDTKKSMFLSPRKSPILTEESDEDDFYDDHDSAPYELNSDADESFFDKEEQDEEYSKGSVFLNGETY